MNAERRRPLMLAGLATLMLAWLMWPEGEHARSMPAAETAASVSTPAAPTAMHAWTALEGLPTESVETKPAMVGSNTAFIRDVFADSDDVCVGEPVVVNVLARDDRASPRDLVVRVGEQNGNPTVLGFNTPGLQHVLIRAFDDRGATDARILDVTVRDCAGAFSHVEVVARALTKFESFAFMAQPHFERPVPAGASVAYDWSFGDGTKATTAIPYVEHSFLVRPQTTPSSSFVIEVTARSAGLPSVAGATAVALDNTAYENRIKAKLVTPLLMANATEDAPEGYSAALTVVNYEPTALTVEKARVEAIPCDEGQSTTYRVAASEVLESTVMPSGKSETRAILRGNLASERFCRVIVTLDGTAPDGLAIRTSFGVIYRTPSSGKTTITDEDLASDPRQALAVARIHDAMIALGRDPLNGTITDDEITALQRKGIMK